MQENKNIKIYLSDIARSINEICGFLPENCSFQDFQNDLKTRKAVERNIEIIGEAMNRIIKINPHFPITASRKVIDTRNRIIHGYDTVSEEILWMIIVNDLPDLDKQVKSMLDKSQMTPFRFKD